MVADAAGMREALDILRSGGVVAHATETCYGFACDLTNPDAVTKLFRIKKRPSDRPVSALFPSVDNAKRYAEWNGAAEELANEHLPGPLTILLSRRPDVSAQLHLTPYSPPLKIGIRVSSHPLAGQLVREFGSPLSTTSANIHGQLNPYRADDIIKQFMDEELQPDVILDSGPLPPTPPSTIVDVTRGDTTFLRRGTLNPW